MLIRPVCLNTVQHCLTKVFGTQLEQVWCDEGINCKPYNKTADKFKLKALADNKMNVNEKLELVSEMVENIVGKKENAGYQNFLLFQQYFQ